MKGHYFSSLVVGAAVAVALLVANVALTLRNTQRLNDDAHWVTHTHEVIAGLENVLSLTKDAETGQRGFVITGEPRYLEPYEASVASILQEVDALERLTVDNAEQQSRFPRLRTHLNNRLEELERIVALRKNETFEAARQGILDGDRGKKEMDALRLVVGEMIEHEQGLLKERAEASEHTYRMAMFTGVVSGLAALASVVAFLLLLKRHLEVRSQAAAVIAEQGERLRTTLASIGDAVISTDTEARITNMNAVAEELTGWKREEAEGKLLVDVFRIVNETTRQTVTNPATRALNEGVIVGLANHTILISKDGTERPIDDSAAPIRCKVGQIVGCVLVFRDVTDRRNAEIELRKHEERLRFVMDSMPQKIFTARASGEVDYFNAIWNEFTGLTFEEIKDWGWKQFIHPDDVAENVRAWQHSVATGEPFYFEHRFRRSDGKYCWHITRAKALTDEQGKVLMWVGSNSDISEQKETQEELRETAARLSDADRRKDEFLATLAHELRNPLAPIRTGLEVLKMVKDDPETSEEIRATMERQTQQLITLVDDLLDVSRITRGKLELRKYRVKLSDVVQSAVEASRPFIDEAHHELSISVDERPIFLDADPHRLAQVLSNLLNNAAKYTPEGGRIWLSAQRQGNEVVFSVKDTGIGIPADMIDRIFEMFAQIDRPMERGYTGLGIGLTLVKSLVEMHQGKIDARSDGVNQGSEFRVRLPILAEIDEDPSAAKPAQGVTPAGKRRVLVVDDNKAAADTLSMVVKMLGNDVRTASDGQQALEIAAEFLPELVLMDLGMPRMTGYEAARHIRNQPWGTSMTLVAMTGWGQDEDKQRTKEAGFDHHMVKPAEPAELQRLLASVERAGS